MLEWCRNQQEDSEPSEILMHAPPSTAAMPRLDTTAHHPNSSMVSSSNTRKHVQRPKKGITLSSSMPLRGQKGITVHSHRSLKDQQAASNESTPKRMVSSWTQTSRMLLEKDSKPEKAQHMGTPEKDKGAKSNLIHWAQPNKMAYLESSPWQTGKKPTPVDLSKSNRHLMDTNYEMNRLSYHRPAPIIGMDSPVQLPTKKRLTFDPRMESNKAKELDLFASKKLSQAQEESPVNSPLRPYGSTYSEKYRTLFKNVESEFRISQAKFSQARIRNTQNRKSLFQGQKTFKSQLNSDGDYSVRIEESIVCENEVRSLFEMIKGKAYPNCKLSIAKEKSIGMIITLKEVPAQLMSTISEELFVYRELQSQGVQFPELLDLYQTQIEDGVFFFIKQPFTENLGDYLERTHNLGEIERGIMKVLQEGEKRGLRLREMPELFDFVMTGRGVKVENGGLFGWEGPCIESEQVILTLRQRLLELVM